MKLKKLITILFLFNLFFSCKQESKNTYLVLKESDTIIVGKLCNGNKCGDWIYKDENGNVIKKEYYHKSRKSVFYYHNNTLIYREDYKDNKCISKYSFGFIDKNRSSNYIFTHECATCHDFNEDFNAKSFRSILKDSLKFDYFKFKSNINHNQINITEEDLFNLKEYIYNNSYSSRSAPAE